ncbi:MAG: Ig-like domain-containing protein, partial [Pseudomonadota bacterium]
ITVLTNDTDPDGDALTITAVDGQAITDGGPAVTVTNGTVQLVAGELLFTPDANFNSTTGGPITFTYTVDDGQGQANSTATTTVTGTVTAVNDAPTQTLPGPFVGVQAALEDSILAIGGVSVGDTDGDPVSVALSIPAAMGTLEVATGGGATIVGNGTASLTLTGLASDINAALLALAFTPAADLN